MRRILVVDDDYGSLALIEQILRSSKYEVDTYSNPSIALDQFRRFEYDLVLSDYFMPEMRGDAVLEAIREVNRDVPFVFLTANTDVNVAITLVKSGADDHVVKPINVDELLFRVDKALQEREQRRMIRQVERERELLELEHRKLVNWRSLYAAKDITQTEQMISLLSRTINQAGGFLWVDLLRSRMAASGTDGGCRVDEDLLEMILTAGESQKAIFDYITFINDLDRMELDVEDTPLWDFALELVRDAAHVLENQSQPEHRRSCRFLNPAAPLHGILRVDRTYLRKILRELAINAAKHSPPDTTVTISVDRNKEHHGDYLDIAFTNVAGMTQAKDPSGNPVVGIPYDYSELVFDLFYTIDAFTRRIDQEEWSDGTGLFVARKLLKRHGGWIRAGNGIDYTGQRPTTITRVTLTLPYYQE